MVSVLLFGSWFVPSVRWFRRTIVTALKIIGLTIFVVGSTAGVVDLSLVAALKTGLFVIGWLAFGYASLVLWRRAAPQRNRTTIDWRDRIRSTPGWFSFPGEIGVHAYQSDTDTTSGWQLFLAAGLILTISFLMEWLFAI